MMDIFSVEEKIRFRICRCVLGDLTHDEDCYQKSWDLSNGHFSRAKRSLGRLAVKKNDVRISRCRSSNLDLKIFLLEILITRNCNIELNLSVLSLVAALPHKNHLCGFAAKYTYNMQSYQDAFFLSLSCGRCVKIRLYVASPHVQM